MSELCRHEPHVIRAVVENQWTDALREHVATCRHVVGRMASERRLELRERFAVHAELPGLQLRPRQRLVPS